MPAVERTTFGGDPKRRLRTDLSEARAAVAAANETKKQLEAEIQLCEQQSLESAMEIETLRSKLATLKAERDELKHKIRDNRKLAQEKRNVEDMFISATRYLANTEKALKLSERSIQDLKTTLEQEAKKRKAAEARVLCAKGQIQAVVADAAPSLIQAVIPGLVAAIQKQFEAASTDNGDDDNESMPRSRVGSKRQHGC